MKRCDYCGRENDDGTTHCGECNQEFKAEEDKPLPERDSTLDAYIPNLLSAGFFKDWEPLDLAGFDMGFSFEEGFSRPDWKLISQQIRSKFDKEQWPQVWREAGIKWLGHLREDLGGDYRQCESRNFLLLSAQTDSCNRAMLRIAEESISEIYKLVGPIDFGKPVHGKHVILVFNEEDDYYSYISHFYPDGEHSRSGGVFISGGYYHVALPYVHIAETRRVLAHELTHNYLCYLRVPRWLNEGLSRRVERELIRIGQGGGGWGGGTAARAPVLNAELAEQHHAFWNEKNIQEFWAGTSFYIPGEANKLSYSLGEVLVELICEHWGNFLDFVKNADPRDSGQDAALAILNRCLGEVAGTFLGPGEWRPRRKAISELWEKGRKATGE